MAKEMAEQMATEIAERMAKETAEDQVNKVIATMIKNTDLSDEAIAKTLEVDIKRVRKTRRKTNS